MPTCGGLALCMVPSRVHNSSLSAEEPVRGWGGGGGEQQTRVPGRSVTIGVAALEPT